jgi:hypothetical protein
MRHHLAALLTSRFKKEEPREESLDLIFHDSDEVEQILRDLNIDPALLSAPAMTPISHLEGATRHNLASDSIYPHHTLRAENLDTVTRKGLEENLAVIVSCTSCTFVHRLPCLHAQNSGPDK